MKVNFATEKLKVNFAKHKVKVNLATEKANLAKQQQQSSKNAAT